MKRGGEDVGGESPKEMKEEVGVEVEEAELFG